MSKFIDVISKGIKFSINVSQIVFVQEDSPRNTVIFVVSTGSTHCVYAEISYEDVMKLIRE
jgi:hypothetical protein